MLRLSLFYITLLVLVLLSIGAPVPVKRTRALKQARIVRKRAEEYAPPKPSKAYKRAEAAKPSGYRRST